MPPLPAKRKPATTAKRRSGTPAAPRWVSINLNHGVRFKLTASGRAYIAKLNRASPIYSRFPLKFQEDAEGWIDLQLWDFANLFGSKFVLGFELPVETQLQVTAS